VPHRSNISIINDKPRNRSLSLRSKSKTASEPTSSGTKHRFGFSSLRASTQPDLAKKLFRLIKSENHVIQSHTSSGREQISIATQLSDWGLSTNDDAISDISDKLGVLLSELGETEILYSQNLEEFRSTLKHIRNTEASVQPSRDNKAKITDEIQKLKYKEPQSPKIVLLEQELVRAEAENLVAEAQLTNITRQKLKEAYASQFAATVERSEKQAILAKHGRRMLNLLDDTPVVPGDTRPAYDLERDARAILSDAEEDLRNWTLDLDEVTSSAHLDSSLMPAQGAGVQRERALSASSSSSSEYAEGQRTTLHGTGPVTGQPQTLEPVAVGAP